MRQRLLSAIFADSRRCVSTRIPIDALSLIIGLITHMAHITHIRFISLISPVGTYNITLLTLLPLRTI